MKTIKWIGALATLTVLSAGQLTGYSEVDMTRLKSGNKILSYRDFKNSNLPRVNLGGANLNKSDFSGSNLLQGNFQYASCKETKFNKCDLRAADFSNADLRGADFSYADLRAAKLRNALIDKTTKFTGAKLTADQKALIKKVQQ